MAITVQSGEPCSFTVGDTVQWSRTEADYQAPTWNLVYGFTGPTRFTVTSADYNTTDHLMTIPTTAGTVKPGVYTWIAKATNGSSSIQIGSGQMTALPDLTASNPELDAIEAKIGIAEAAWHSISAKQNVDMSVDGISYTKKNSGELWTYLARLRRERTRLINEQRGLLSQSTGNVFVTRFRN